LSGTLAVATPPTVSVSNATITQANPAIAAFAVADTAANIVGGLAALSLDTKLIGLTATDTTVLSLGAADYLANQTLLNLLAQGETATVLGLSATAAAIAQADAEVGAFTVADTAANILARLAALNLATKLTSLQVNDTSVLKLGATDYLANTSLFDKLPAPEAVSVTGLSVLAAGPAQADATVAGFTIADTAANILANLPTLSLYGDLTSFSLTDTATLAVTAAQFAAFGGTLDKIAAGQSLAVSGLSASDAGAAQADPHVGSFTVADSAANVLGSLAALKADTHLGSIVLTDTDTLAVDGATFVANKATLDKLAPGESMVVSGVTAASSTAAQADTHVASFTVSDTRLNVWNAIDALNAETHLTHINLTNGGPLNVTYAKFQLDTNAIAKLGVVTVSEVTASGAGALGANAAVQHITVTDTLAHIGASLDSLEVLAKSGMLTGIKVSDTGQSLSLSQAQYDADHDALALLAGNFMVTPQATTDFVIKLQYNASMAYAPTGFKLGLNEAVTYFEHLFTNKETVTIGVGYGEIGGAALGSGVLGVAGPTNGVTVSYGAFQAALASHATSDVQISAAHFLATTANQAAGALYASTHNTAGGLVTPDEVVAPSVINDDADELYFALSAAAATAGTAATMTDPTHGGRIYVASAEAKALGLMAPDAPGLDGVMGFSSRYGFSYDPANRGVSGKFDFIGVVEHELTHALGRIALLGTGYDSALDLFRYSADGVHALSPTTRAYFSVDGGHTNQAWFATTSDLGDWASSPTADANNAFATAGTPNVFSAVDIMEMNALGYALA